MRNISDAMKAHLAGESTTLTTLWKLNRIDGAVFGFTDLDADVVYNDGTGSLRYLASTGFIPSSIEATSALAVDNLEIQGVLDSSTITDTDLLAGKWDRAEVRVYRVNYRDLTMGHEYLNRGILGEVSSGRNAFQAEMRGLTQHLQQQMAEVVQPTCVAMFGDAKCGKAIASFTFAGAVTGVINGQSFVTNLTAATNYFAKGKMAWLTGNNAGLSMDIKFFGGAPNYTTLTFTGPITGGTITPTVPSGKTFALDHSVVSDLGVTYKLSDTPSATETYEPTTGGIYYFNTLDEGKTVTITYAVMDYTTSATGQVDLQLYMPYPIQVGDTFSAVAGCDKTMTVCKNSFSNIVNFRGFPHLPGRDRLISGKS